MAHVEERRFVVSTRYGGTGGSPWDDGLYHGVREITLTYGDFIASIAVGYYKNGQNINAETHGQDHGQHVLVRPIRITLDSDEFITKVSGYIDEPSWATNQVIRSLIFQTNIREHGPYGQGGGTPFTLTVNHGDRIIGFFGSSGSNLDAIGIHTASNIPHP